MARTGISHKSFAAIAIGAMVSAVLFAGTVMAHNLIVSATISPSSGSTVTTSELVVSGTFGNSGCGLNTDIDVQVSDGIFSGLTTSCVDGLWSWSGTWSGYADGPQSVTADFLATHGAGNSFLHSGTITAQYLVETFCDAPAAPAIANAYLRELGVTNRNHITTIIPAVAHAMNAGEFGENPCADGYEEAVRAFVDEMLSGLAD